MILLLLGLIIVFWTLGMVYGVGKRLPDGLGRQGAWHLAELEFIYDLNYNFDGRRVHEPRILSTMLAEIERARHFIIVDIFLFNDLGGSSILGDDLASPTTTLADALVAARLVRPELPVLFISDEINTGYGSYVEPHLARMAAQGVEVVLVDLTKLPDPNPIYSGLWRSLLQWFFPAAYLRLPNIFAADAPAISLASYLRMLNFKANHRKLLITEQVALVSSSNIHDASARHSNIALRVNGGGVIADLIASELAVARFSGHNSALLMEAVAPTVARGNLESSPPGSKVETLARVLSEGAIKTALLHGLAATTTGDRLWVGQFYLTNRAIMTALVDAAKRGVEVRLILDASNEAFGLKKYGIPNRSSAAWLKARGEDNLQIRWYNSDGEQFHAKLILIEYDVSGVNGGRARLISGSANYTRRNLSGYTMETCLEVYATADAAVIVAVRDFFTRLWFNREGHYTVDYEEFAERCPIKAALVAWQEFSGMGTF